MSRIRCTLAAAALTACLVTAAVARPAAVSAESGERDDESAELWPAVSGRGSAAVPARAFADPDSPFGRALRARLSAMSDGELAALQNTLSAAKPATAVVVDDDDEMMMGDMPADGADRPAEDANATEARIRDRERNKKLMIQNIQMKVMSFVGFNGRTPPSPNPLAKMHPSLPVNPITTGEQTDALRVLYENVNNLPYFPADMFTEKMQSFYPVCDVPKHTHEDVWNARDVMNLMFNVSLPKPANGNSVNVSLAKLRLFKQLVSCSSPTSNETTDDPPNCQPTFSEEVIKRSNATNLSSSAEVPLIIEDIKQIRVSVYVYTRSLRKKRVKRKLLDSRMLPYYSEKWTDWNIGSAVKSWHRDPNRNYGLSIEVEDEDGNLLPVNRFFKPMNCTGDVQMTTPKPIPGFLMEEVQRGYGLTAGGGDPAAAVPLNASSLVQAFSLNLYRYPMADVATVEVPDSEVNNALLYQYARHAMEQNLQQAATGRTSQLAAAGSSQPEQQAADQGERHRIRHGGNGRHRADATADASDAAGREFRDRIVMKSVVYRNPKAPSTPHPTDFPESST